MVVGAWGGGRGVVVGRGRCRGGRGVRAVRVEQVRVEERRVVRGVRGESGGGWCESRGERKSRIT